MPAQKYSGSVAYARAKRGLVVTEFCENAWKEDGFVVNAMHPGQGIHQAFKIFANVSKNH